MARLIVKKEDVLYNYRLIAERMGVPVIPVLKGNGYGLGAEALFTLFQAEGVPLIAVSCLEEALPLSGRGVEILVLSCYETPEFAEIALEKGLTVSVGSPAFAALLSEKALAAGKTARVHLKIDTGMGRFGFFPGQTEEIAAVFALPGLEVTGIFSHCYAAFAADGSAEKQLELFNGVTAALEARGIAVPMRHLANSSAACRPGFALDAVRIGSALTGRLARKTDLPLKKVGRLEAEVLAVRNLPAGSNVGYGGVCRLKKDTTVAVVAAGTAEGFSPGETRNLFRMRDICRYLYHDCRLFFKRPVVYGIVGGKRAAMLSRPAITHSFFDVTGLDCKPGDVMVLEAIPFKVDSAVERVYE